MCSTVSSKSIRFPDPRDADDDGVVAVGGPFNGERLLEAYRSGIFPWNGDPVRWYSPDPRSIFWRVKLPRRLGKMARKGGFRVSFDRAFAQTISACAAHHRDAGVWITPAFEQAYAELHEMGYAHSVEVWQGERLVGGLYGVQVGALFSGESMFHHAPNASKVAFAALAYHLRANGTAVFDSQVINEHTYRLGAVLVSRDDFLQLVAYATDAKQVAQSVGSWRGQQIRSLRGTDLEPLADAEDQSSAAATDTVTPDATDLGRPVEVPMLRFWSFEDEPHHSDAYR